MDVGASCPHRTSVHARSSESVCILPQQTRLRNQHVAPVGRYGVTAHLDKPFRDAGGIAWIVSAGTASLDCIPHPARRAVPMSAAGCLEANARSPGSTCMERMGDQAVCMWPLRTTEERTVGEIPRKRCGEYFWIFVFLSSSTSNTGFGYSDSTHSSEIGTRIGRAGCLNPGEESP